MSERVCPVDDGNFNVAVKFRGSKIAYGTTTKLAIATIDDAFMNNLTDLNKAILAITTTEIVGPKKKKLEDGVTPKIQSGNGSNKKSKFTVKSAPEISVINSDISCAAGSSDLTPVAVNARPTACLTIKPSECSHSESWQQSRKTTGDVDPAHMDITCSHDFWQWLDTQDLFRPFSVATHPVNLLALQGERYGAIPSTALTDSSLQT